MNQRSEGILEIREATQERALWRVGDGRLNSATMKQIEYSLKMIRASESTDVVNINGSWLDESDLLHLYKAMSAVTILQRAEDLLQARRREYEKAQAQNRREWNAEAVEAQHRFAVDDARADYIADNYSPEDWS